MIEDRTLAPNGIAFSSDGQPLRLTDIGRSAWPAYDVTADSGVTRGRVFTGVPAGNLTRGEDGAPLFITADARLLRLRTATIGLDF